MIHAAVVVGADGVGGIVRRTMGLSRGTLCAQVIEVDTEPVAGDVDRAFLHFDGTDRRYSGYAWDFPSIVGGDALVCRGIYHLKRRGEDVDIRALLAERLARMGLDLAKCRIKRFAERGYEPVVRLTDGVRMLVGEAAGIDPVTGEGIAQAIEYGALAGRFLAGWYERGVPLSLWERAVKRSRLAIDLAIRSRATRLFYGASRAGTEDFLLRSPDALHVGCQHFAAQRVDRARLAAVMLRLGFGYLAGTFSGRGIPA
jgi:flavin-dependent dehydrogenase